MKKSIALVLAMIMTLTLLSGCNVKSKPAQGGDTGNAGAMVPTTPEAVNILTMSMYEKETNVLRDQLVKAGFDVKINTQPDFSSFSSVRDAGQYDIIVTGWTTVTGNPDYAVRSLFITGGDYNQSPISDAKIDELIEKASTETADKYVKTYKELEDYMVTDMAYIVPIFSSLRTQAINVNVIDPTTVRHPKSRSSVWEMYEYVDKTQNETRPYVMTSTLSSLTSMHPVKANDGSVNSINTSIYSRLISLSDEDVIETEGSMSYSYAIGEGNTEYYFLLRDDVFFCKVADKKVVETDERVGGEDVVYSLNLAKDGKSVPDHRTFTLHSSMDKIEIITDLDSLKNTKDSSGTGTVLDTLNKTAPKEIASLVGDKTKVDGATGKYQVVKITTTKAFPQVLNFLAHQSAGIVSEKAVRAINDKVDMANYDPKTDIIYGDQSVVTEGPTYNNHLVFSGPYAMLYKNDYEVVFAKNPGFKKGTKEEPKIVNMKIKFIKDNDSALAAFRAGEIDTLGSVAEDKIQLIENDPNFKVQKRTSNGVSYLGFNLREGSKFKDVDLRKAVLYAVNQDDYIATFNGLKNRCYSTVSTIIDTGNVLTQDLVKSNSHLAAYQAKAK